MLFRTIFALITLISLTLVSGCSDLFKSKVVKKTLESAKFSANCDLDIDKFSQIMFEKIPDTINCLGENLNLFIRVVESDKAGYLSKTALRSFIEKNRTDIDADSLRALEAVFDINFLIFGEERNYISQVKINKIINFAKLFNDTAALNFRIFQSSDSLAHNEYVVLRNRIDDNSLYLSNKLREIFNHNRNGAVHSLNISDLLNSFTSEANRESVGQAYKLLFIKKMIVGGERNIITDKELWELVQNFNKLSTIALDITRFKSVKLDNGDIVDFLKKPLSSLAKIIYADGPRTNEHFFNMQEAIDGVKLFITPELFDIDKFRSLVNEGKQILIGGSGLEVTGGEFKKLLTHAENVLTTGSAFYQIYNNFKPQLDSTRPLTIDFSQYRHNYPERIKELEEFSRIITRYRFFKGESLSALYATNYARNPKAIFEIYAYEYLLKLVFNHSSMKDGVLVPWASPSNGLGGKSMNVDQVLALVKRFEKELVELDIILPKKAASTAESVSLLGSLFQFQSDDNKVLDVNEATEFLISLLTSIDIGSDLMVYYKKNSDCEIDGFNRIEPVCFKQHFFKSLCAKGYHKYYPRLFESLGAKDPKSCEVLMDAANTAYLETAIRAARSCNVYPDDQKEIPYSEGDIFTIFLGMMHIETTIIKWDVRGVPNNVMDPDEVMDAYPTYSTALDGFMDDMPSIVKALKKQIYQYLIKYETIPDSKSIGKFLRFLVGKKKAPANRKTIASILATISEESAKKTPESERFDCNALHNPDQIGQELSVEPLIFSRPVNNDKWMGIENHADYQFFLKHKSEIEE